MTHPILGGSEGQDSPLTYHLEAVVEEVVEEEEEAVEEEEEAVEEEEEAVEEEEEAEEAVIPEIKMTEVPDKS